MWLLKVCFKGKRFPFQGWPDLMIRIFWVIALVISVTFVMYREKVWLVIAIGKQNRCAQPIKLEKGSKLLEIICVVYHLVVADIEVYPISYFLLGIIQLHQGMPYYTTTIVFVALGDPKHESHNGFFNFL